MKKSNVIAALLLGCSFLTVQAQKETKLEIVKKIKIEGDEKWDYLYSDDQAARLYVSHGSMVQIIDETKGEVIGKVTGLNGVHGIAIATELNKGFISNGKDSSVTVFDTKSFAVITKISVTGKGPDAILFDSFSKKVYVFNGKSNNATVIDAQSNKIIATIAFEGNPEFSASNENGLLYVNIESKSIIAVINTKTNKVEKTFVLAPGEEPTGLTLDIENHRLFSVCANKMMIVLDAETGKIITTIPSGEKTDGVAFDPTLKIAFSSNGEGTVTVVKEENKDSFKLLQNFKTQKGAKTIAVNKVTHHIYLPTADFEATQAGEKPKVVPGSFFVFDIEVE
jgi:YVTN family beta-propeller protein